jgi:hypothetical protein
MYETRIFYPRDIPLRRLDEALLPLPRTSDEDRTENLSTFVLCGLGGIGKTEIALEFAFSRQEHFDAIFFLHADQSNKLADEFGQISVKLVLETAEESKDPIESRERVKSWLANPIKHFLESESFGGFQDSQGSQTSVQSGKGLANWLIVFDNADHPELLANYWPSDGYGSVLVTNRDPMSMTQFFFGDVDSSSNHFLPRKLEHFYRILLSPRMNPKQRQHPKQLQINWVAFRWQLHKWRP